MLRFQAILLLNQIASINPELLQRATQICLDPEESTNCRIIIKSDLTEEERALLLKISAQKGVEFSQATAETWVIQ